MLFYEYGKLGKSLCFFVYGEVMNATMSRKGSTKHGAAISGSQVVQTVNHTIETEFVLANGNEIHVRTLSSVLQKVGEKNNMSSDKVREMLERLGALKSSRKFFYQLPLEIGLAHKPEPISAAPKTVKIDKRKKTARTARTEGPDPGIWASVNIGLLADDILGITLKEWLYGDKGREIRAQLRGHIDVLNRYLAAVEAYYSRM